MSVGRTLSLPVDVRSLRWRRLTLGCSDVVVAATLHDLGYAHPWLDFHPLDGVRFLAEQGFSKTICHLVAHHSAST
jgi:hypothetical protein